jgi:hypothetical protein
MRRAFPALCVLAAALCVGGSSSAQDAAPTFDADVKPILKKHCTTCHNAERPRGDLDLTTFGGVTAGGITGKAVTPKKSDASPLYTMTAHLEDPKMPPNKPKIPQREIDTIRKWIDGGLVEKAGKTASVAAAPAGGFVAAVPLARATPVTALAVSPAKPLVAVPGKKQVLLFELPSAKLLGALAFPEGEVHALRFSRDGSVLLAAGGVGGQSGVVVGFEVGTWKRLFSVTDDTDAVLAADISADKSRVVFGGPARVVKVVSVPDGKVLHALRKPTDWVLSVGFSPEGLLVAAGDRFGGLYAWEAKSGKEFAVLRGHTKGVTALAWRSDSDALASCSEDGTVRVWDMHTAAEVAKWDAHADGALDIAFHGKDALATAGRDGRAKVWDAKGKPLADLGPMADAVLKVAFTADAKTVIAGDWAGAVTAWPATGGAAASLAQPVDKTTTKIAAVPVPTPPVVTVAAPVAVKPTTVTQPDLVRKRAALKAVEDAAEKLKDEAARSPKNAALAKAYLQLCEAALALKADVIEAEAASAKGDK